MIVQLSVLNRRMVGNNMKEDELIKALELMALQYLMNHSTNEMNHHFMSAGEACLDMLEKERLVYGSDPIYKFTRKSEFYSE